MTANVAQNAAKLIREQTCETVAVTVLRLLSEPHGQIVNLRRGAGGRL